MLNDLAGDIREIEGREYLQTRPGRRGHAVYGPYETLAPGRYKVEFLIQALEEATDGRDPLIAIADVQAGLSSVFFDQMVFRSDIAQNGRYRAYFETDRPLEGFEYRLFVNGAEALLIGASPLVTVADGPAPASRRRSLPALLRAHEESVRALFFLGVGVATMGPHVVASLAGRSFVLKTADDLRAVEDAFLKIERRSAPETAGPASGRRVAPVVVLGTRAPFGDLGFALVGHAMDVVYGAHRRLHCEKLDELRERWDGEGEQATLITSDSPDTALSYLMTTSGFPVLAFFDDPFRAAVYPALVEGRPLAEALRAGTRRFSCLIGCTGSEHVRIFDEGCLNSDLAGVVAEVLSAIGVEPDTALTIQVVDRFRQAEGAAPGASLHEILRGRTPGELAARLAPERFDADSTALIRWFIENYGSLLTGRESDVIEWPLKLFFVGEQGEGGENEVRLIGRARHIFWGPYLHLPLGGWRAQVQFEVLDNFSGNEIECDVWAANAQAEIAKCVAKLPTRGFFQFSIDFVNADPNAALELRVRLIKGAIEGRFGVRRVTLRPLSDLSEVVGAHASGPVQALQDTLS